MKKWYFIALFVLGFISGSSAIGPLSGRAYEAYKVEAWDLAKTLIDSAIADANESKDPFTWHLRGFIYKDIYKSVDNRNRTSVNREIAYDSYSKSIELDTAKDYLVKNQENLGFLAKTYFKDAIDLLDTVNYQHSEEYFLIYKQKYAKVDPAYDFRKDEIDFYNTLATIISRKFIRTDVSSEKYFDMAIRTYKKVIELDSNNCLAHYQIAVLYYNRGVEILLAIPADADLEEIFKAQEICIGLFKLSQPHMLKAWELRDVCKNLNPSEIAEGLSGIYYQLNEPDQFKIWDEKKKEEQNK